MERKGLLVAELRAYARNSGWMLIEYVVRAVAGLLVGVQVARYLGPQAFGMLNFSLAVVALASPVVHFGLDALVIKRLSIGLTSPSVLLGTVFRIRLLSGGAGFLAISLLGLVLTPDPTERLCLVVIAACLVFQATDVIDFFYQANGHAALTSSCRTAVVLLAGGLNLHWSGNRPALRPLR